MRGITVQTSNPSFITHSLSLFYKKSRGKNKERKKRDIPCLSVGLSLSVMKSDDLYMEIVINKYIHTLVLKEVK